MITVKIQQESVTYPSLTLPHSTQSSIISWPEIVQIKQFSTQLHWTMTCPYKYLGKRNWLGTFLLYFNPGPRTPIFITRACKWGGGSMRPPASFETNGRRAERKKTGGALSPSTRDWWCFFILGQYMTQLWEAKGQIFAKPGIFQLYFIILKKKTIDRSDLKPSPTCSPFNSE